MKRVIGAAAGCLLLGYGPASHGETLKIWLRAFIPNDLPGTPGYVRLVPGQTDQWMIPGPGIPWVTNGPIPLVGSCYNTNDRGFSSKADAEGKVTSGVTVKIKGGKAESSDVIPPPAVSTLQFNCQTGEVTCDKSVTLTNVHVKGPAAIAGRIEYDLDADAENACIPLVEWTPARVVPSIKWRGKLVIVPGDATVTFTGTTAEFPAYEAYVAVDGGEPVTLFTRTPADGATVWSLIKDKPLDATAHYYSLEGSWKTNDPGGRFALTITGETCVFSEVGASGTFKRTVKVERSPGGVGYRIRRANTDTELLTFLGFQPSIQKEMLSRDPQDSYLDLSFDAGALSASWSGILVIKDAQGKFKEMKQPGQSPPKAFVFQRQ